MRRRVGLGDGRSAKVGMRLGGGIHGRVAIPCWMVFGVGVTLGVHVQQEFDART